MNIIRKHFTKILIIILIISILLALTLKTYLNQNKNNIIEEKEKAIEIPKKEEKEDNNKKVISIDIKGAIKNPGVYDTEENKKIIDIVKLAGGLTNEADTTYINLAKKVTDEMVIIIYTKDQIKEAKKKETLMTKDISNSCICPKINNDACINKETVNTSNNKITTNNSSKSKENSNNSSTNTNAIININTATIEELQTLPGVGQSKAEAIIKYREENGDFTQIEDIKNVSGIGDSLYEKIKNNITI